MAYFNGNESRESKDLYLRDIRKYTPLPREEEVRVITLARKGDKKALEGAEKLAGLDSTAATAVKKQEGVLKNNEAVEPQWELREYLTAEAVPSAAI